MLIIVTDEGRFWNHKNPALKPYANCVLVVCLSGKAVTEEYQCFVSPYQGACVMGRMDDSDDGQKFQALESVRYELRATHDYYDDILFLTDESPQSLYPYLILREMERHNRIHLWCSSPFGFQEQKIFDRLFSSLSELRSLLYLDAAELCKLPREGDQIADVINARNRLYHELLPSAICDISTKMERGKRYFFDLCSRRYLEADGDFEQMLAAKPLTEEEILASCPEVSHILLGALMFEENPQKDKRTKQLVEKLQPRFNGKRICEQLKKMRKALLEANGLDYPMVDCPMTGPCAGTCPQCDKEIAEIQRMLSEIPSKMRVYPQVSSQEICNTAKLPEWVDYRYVISEQMEGKDNE